MTALTVLRTGQQGVLLGWEGLQIGIDLFLSPAPGRLLENIVDAAGLGGLDLLLGTHDHEDHIDREAWKQIAAWNQKVRFVVPSYFQETLPGELGIPAERFLFAGEEGAVSFRGISIRAAAAAHETVVRDGAGRSAALIYVLDFPSVRVCHMGDTCRYEGLMPRLREMGPFDLLFVPINGRDAARWQAGCLGNMTYQEAADLAGDLSPRLTVPGHYDMFSGNGEDPDLFLAYLQCKHPNCRGMILPAGREISYLEGGECL